MTDALAAALERNRIAAEKARAAREAKPKYRCPPIPITGEIGAKWPAADHITVRRMAEDGKTGEEIGRAIGRHADTVSRYCDQQGIPLFKRSARKLRVPDAVICEEYLDGASSIMLANKYGVTDGAIINVLIRNDVKRRSMTEAERLRRVRDAAAEYAARRAEIHEAAE